MSNLELRRLRADLVLCFKLLNGLTVVPPENYGLILRPTISRGHDLKLYRDHDRIDARKHFFSTRVCAPWNSLSMDVVHSVFIGIFKNNLTHCDLSPFMQQVF